MSDFLRNLDKWCLDEVTRVKQAEERGETSHPSESADDGNQTASTGARASEHEKDIKSQVPGQTVNEAKGSDVAGPGRGENSPSFNTVTKSRATGEDAAVETSSAKGKPEDPGTSHPAKADMGEKFSAAQLKGIGDSILADIAVASALTSKSAEAMPESFKKDEKIAKPSGETSGETSGTTSGETSGTASGETSGETAKEVGKQAAAAVIGAMAQPVASQSEIIDSVVKQASVDAENVADFLAGYFSKQADPAGDMMGGGAAPEAAAVDPAAAAGAAPEAGAGGGDQAQMEQVVQALLEAGVSPEELMALIQGQGAGADAGAAPAGGADMAAGAPEAAPAAGGI